ncbi:DUF2382 domain-containing protein [Planococcus sp. YIM B11945]|uniref:DUF2382 domain-containing protein n=1 Tax=Planococcus sp. YIM B11945 TaxID=3435410 RepID=UPI003D7C611E
MRNFMPGYFEGEQDFSLIYINELEEFEMADNKFMGTFDNETEVLRKIEELKAEGATEDHMYVMAKDEDQLTMVRGRTDVDYKSAEGSWKDKFMGFLSGNEPVRQAFAGMGVDEQEAERYHREVQNGRILLFVDRDYVGNDQSAESSQSSGAPVNAAYGTPSPDRTNYVDTGTVARDGLTVDTNDQNDVYFNEDRRNLYADGSKSPSSSADTSYEESAGVGDKTGTGFGLGTGGNVNDTPQPDRNVNDFSATNQDRDSSMTSDSSTGMFGSGGQGENERTSATRGGSGIFGSSDTDRSDDSTRTAGLGADSTGDRSSGTFASGSVPPTDGNVDRAGSAGDTDEETLRLHEERLNVDKERVQTGEVNVGKHIVEETKTVDVPVEREEIYIERRPVNSDASSAGSTGSGISKDAYQEGDNIHIPLTEERVEVTKKDVVSEEIIVGKRKVQDTETVRETVRREEADIDDDTDNLDRGKKDRL